MAPWVPDISRRVDGLNCRAMINDDRGWCDGLVWVVTSRLFFLSTLPLWLEDAPSTNCDWAVRGADTHYEYVDR